MTLRLFDFERAPNPRRVRIFLAEKQLTVQRIPVNLFRMEQLSPEFLAINPGGTVPVLETEDGTCLSECLAICRYLEHLKPEPGLFGSTPRQEALTLMWNGIVEQEGLNAIAEVLRNLSPGFRDHVFPGPGRFTLKLTVEDDRGAEDSLTRDITLVDRFTPPYCGEEEPCGDDPASIAAWEAGVRSIETPEFTDEEQAEMARYREESRRFNLEAIRRQMEDGVEQ